MNTVMLASGIFSVTFGMILFRPKGINEGTAGLIGAVLMLTLGLVSWRDVGEVFGNTGGILTLLLAMMIISIIVDEAGFFQWVALHAAHLAKGNARRLFLNTFLMGTFVTTVISNDATALIITPIVFGFVTTLGLNPLPFLLACTFIADTASLSLPVSNLTNLLVYDQMGLTFLPYVLVMLLPTLIAVIVNYLIFKLLFARQIPQFYNHQMVDPPASAIRHPRFFRLATIGLLTITCGYVIGSMLGIPLVYIGVLGAVFMLMAGQLTKQIKATQVLSQVSWSVLLFVIGMFIVVKGIQNTGLPQLFAHWLLGQAGESLFRGILFTSFGAALGSNVINNVPMDMMMISVLKELPRPEWLHPLSYATVLGAGLGPNLTVIGSLATMLWLGTVRRKGISITAWEYFKIGLLTAPLMILLAATALYFSVRLLM